ALRRQLHGLHIDEFANAIHAKLAAVAGALDAAEGKTRVGYYRRVDEYHAGFNLAGEAILLTGIVGPGGGAEAESRVVGDADGVVDAIRAQQHRYGAEHLLAIC